MKGLLVKDFRIALSEKSELFYLLFAALFFFVIFGDISIGLIVLSMFFFFVLLGDNYDETDNMSTFLLTLPITRKAYIKEKFLLCIIVFLISNMTLYTPLLILKFINGKSYFTSAYLGCLVIIILTTASFIDIPLKFKIKYKTGKYSVLISGIIGLTIMFANSLLIRNIFKWIKITDISFEYRSLCELLSLTVIALFVFYISYIISLRIIDKKEF